MSANQTTGFLLEHQHHTTPEPNSGCILWTGARTAAGYGVFGGQYAHRTCYEWRHGTGSAAGRVVRHKCDTPACVNPDHLEIGTPADNTRDMMRRGRHRALFGEQSPSSVLSEADVNNMRRAISGGASVAALAAKFGVSKQTVRSAAVGTTWKTATGAPVVLTKRFGSSSYQSKLTESLVREIKSRLGTESHRAIASRYGVSRPTITAISQGRNWKHVL